MPSLPLSTIAATAHALVAPGKGILAADESFPTIEKRFKSLGIISTEETRRAYRETLFTAPGLGDFISGVILFEETLRQKSHAGIPFPELLQRHDLIPGIKVDHGLATLANFPGEKITQGLDGLRERLKTYHELGARFTKWRAVLTITPQGLPSRACLEINAHHLALFAALSQEADLVPIVEPEILMTGAHDIERCEEVAEATLHAVFSALVTYRVQLEALLLKTAMILPGIDCPRQAPETEIASHTLRCLRRTVPPAVPGIVFLSGGQTPEQATRRLAAINHHANATAPWALTFSFGRALQEPALNAWRGNSAHVLAAQAALLDHARQNSAALIGGHTG